MSPRTYERRCVETDSKLVRTVTLTEQEIRALCHGARALWQKRRRERARSTFVPSPGHSHSADRQMTVLGSAIRKLGGGAPS